MTDKKAQYHLDHLFNMAANLKKRIDKETGPARRNRMLQDLGSLEYALIELRKIGPPGGLTGGSI